MGISALLDKEKRIIKTSLVAVFASALFLVACGDDKGTGPATSSQAGSSSGLSQGGSQTAVSSGASVTSGTSSTGGSSASAQGAIPDLAVAFVGGNYWIQGNVQAPSAISAVTTSVLLKGASVTSADLRVSVGTPLGDLFTRGDLTKLDLSQMKMKVIIADAACNATYQIVAKVDAGAWSVADTADLVWEFGPSDCP